MRRSGLRIGPSVFEGGGSVKEDLTDRPSAVAPTGTAVRGEVRNHADFVWSVADLLRGDYKRSEYGKVILPLTVLRRLDGVLEPTKVRVLEKRRNLPKRLDPILNRITGVQFNNTSELDLRRVLDDPPNVADGLRAYVAGFSENVRVVFERFDLDVLRSRRYNGDRGQLRRGLGAVLRGGQPDAQRHYELPST
jgi:hypothetical protein